MHNHYVICGFGSTGRSAAIDLMRRGVEPADMVAVDRSEEAVEAAVALGLAAVHGDATRNSVLQQAAIDRARAVIVVPSRDDTAVLIILTARELNPEARIVAGGREQENLHLLRQGGADEVIDATAAVGRMLGLGTHAPGAVDVVDDLLEVGTGLELVQVEPDLDGLAPSVPPGAMLMAVVRDGQRVPAAEVGSGPLLASDRLIVLRRS